MPVDLTDTTNFLRSVIYFPINFFKTHFNNDSLCWTHKWLHFGVIWGWILTSTNGIFTRRIHATKSVVSDKKTLLEKNKQLREALNNKSTKVTELEERLNELNSNYIEASKKVEAGLMKRVKEDQECVSKQQDIVLTLIKNKILSQDQVKELLLPFTQKIEKELKEVTRTKQKLIVLLEELEAGSSNEKIIFSASEPQTSIAQLTKVGEKFEILITQLTKFYFKEPTKKTTYG